MLVAPAARGGKRLDPPDGIEVDDSLAMALAQRPGLLRTLWNAIACPALREEISRRSDVVRSPAALRRLAAFAAAATRVARWYERFAQHQGLDSRSTVLYTYWLDALSAGALLAAVRHPPLVVVSRAHRVDVYEELQRPPYLPCRRWLMGRLERIFVISEHGRSYLLSRYPEAAARVVLSRLGTPEPGFLASPSADGVLRVVSCAAFLPVKQVDVLARGLIRATRMRPDHAVEWQHFGDGPLRVGVERLLRESAPKNLLWDCRGRVPNTDIIERYRSRPVDLFANTSLSEGIPVAIMEAQSCGIPAMAPAVGGVPEAISPDNGFLLPPAVDPDDVAAILKAVLATPQLLESRRARSREAWEARFNAAENFASFARDLGVVGRARRLASP